MGISNNKNSTRNSGFTIIELIIVIAGLAALGSFSIPNILGSIKLSKIEEAKAIMNSYAAECLGKYRISTDPVDFIENAVPDTLDAEKLATLGFNLDGTNNTCSHLSIKPSSDNEKDLFEFDFRMSSEGDIFKTAIPSDNPRFLNSCKTWAGSNCGLSDAQKAEFERIAALAKAKSTCLSNYSKWLGEGNSGESISWDPDTETCTKKVWAFEGTPVANAEAVEEALKAKYGRACFDWRQSKTQNTSYVSPGGNPETKDPECGGVKYWFHTGNEYTNQADWTSKYNTVAQNLCTSSRSGAISNNTKGEFVVGPSPGPDPCGNVIWLCKGKVYNSDADYQKSDCVPKGGNGDDDNGGGTPKCNGIICRNSGKCIPKTCTGFAALRDRRCRC